MGTQVFDSQEEMDDAFEDLMTKEEDKSRLRRCIERQEDEIEHLEAQLSTARDELQDLNDELSELESE